MTYLVMGLTQGTGSTGGPHQYWRVLITVLNSARAIFPEIEMRESVGGADITTTGFAYASSGTASAAFNNVPTISGGEYWEPTAPDVGSWVGQDFGAGNEKAIVEMKFWQYGGPYPLPQVDIQYSDDNSNWTTVTSVTYTPSWPLAENIITF